jgi:hypothetical protein
MLIAITLSVFLTTELYAKEVINVVTRYSHSSVVSQNLASVLEILNKKQSKYEFRYSHVPGAEGESANLLAIERARNDVKVLWFGAASTFTYSRLQFKNRKWNEEEDFVFLNGMASGGAAVLVNQEFQGTIYDLLNSMSKKDKAFTGYNINTVASIHLNNVFKKHYGLETKVKDISSYGSVYDVINALVKNEIDYTVFGPSEIPTARPLLIAGEERLEKYPDVPTGREMGVPKFNQVSMSFFAVPKEMKLFGDEIDSLLKELCRDEELKAKILMRGYSPRPLCYDGAKIKSMIDKEYSEIKHLE